MLFNRLTDRPRQSQSVTEFTATQDLPALVTMSTRGFLQAVAYRHLCVWMMCLGIFASFSRGLLGEEPGHRSGRVVLIPSRATTVEKVRPVSEMSCVPAWEPSVTSVNPGIPADVAQPWWLEKMSDPMRREVAQLPVSLESLLLRTLVHSHQIKVFSELPLIRETAIVEADAAFDWYGFLESRWDDTDDPVGSTLTGVPIGGRYKNNQLSNVVGARRRTIVGGKLEVAQRFGVQDTNSAFFSPNPQGTARLTLGYTQPLLRGAGRTYNSSLTCLAIIDTEIAEEEFSRQVQSQLLEVARAFWTLHVQRASVAQRWQSVRRASDVVTKLQKRQGIDAVVPQLQRAEAEIATRQAELLRSLMSVRTAEAKIRSLVNDPELGTFDSLELIPVDRPTTEQILVDMDTAMSVAMQFRPEVAQALKQVQAGCVRMRISKSEMLPVLNLVTETYVAGLQDNGSVGDAWTDQYSRGGPGYGIGGQFEAPLGNRAAQARMDRRILETRQLRNQYDTTLKTLNLEVGVAVREVRASYSEMLSQSKVVRASATQLEQIEKRWNLLPGEDGNGSLVMENMLQAQARLTRAEGAYLNAWITYNLSLINLKKTTGELLKHEYVTWNDYRSECNDIKTRYLSKPDLDISTSPPVEPTIEPVEIPPALEAN